MPVEIRIMGPVEAWADGRRIEIGSSAQQALLGALALAGRRMPFEELATALWGGSPPATYRQQLHKRVHELRRVLGDDAVRTEDGGYRLADCQTDLRRFTEELHAARAEEDTAKAITLFRSALSLWRGPGVAELDETRLRALEDCVELELGLGRHAVLVRELRAVTANHPLRERLVGQLMVALHRSGRQAEALEAFHRFRVRLAGERGGKPPAALQRLHDAVLHDEFDPARRIASCELPSDTTAFTGRAAELAKLDELLGEPGVVVAAIDGQAGVGKSALALHWAHRVRRAFPHGQVYLNLGEPEQPLTRLLHALGVPGERIPEDLAARAALYRSAVTGKRLLIVLDNAVDADQVRPLLPDVAGCVVLVTSRAAVESTARIRVSALSAVDSAQLLAHLLGAERVAAEPDAVRELATRCGRLPLPLRVVAAHLAARPRLRIAEACVRGIFGLAYRALSQEAGHVLRCLADVPADHLMPEAIAALADHRDVAAPLEELAAAHLVEQALPGRYRLHDQVRRHARGQADSGTLPRLVGWYVAGVDAAVALLAPTLYRETRPYPLPDSEFADRDTALAWLRAERTHIVAAVSWAFACGADALCAHLVDALRGYFLIDRTQPDWITTGEIGLAAARRLGDAALQAAAHRTLGLAYGDQERLDEARHHHLCAAELAERRGDPLGAAISHANLGTALLCHAHADEITGSLATALRVSRDLGQPELTLPCLVRLGIGNLMRGKLIETMALTEEAIRAARTVHSPHESAAHGVRGTALLELGELEQARAELEISVRLSPSLTDRLFALVRNGLIHLSTSRVDEAVDALDHAMRLADECDDADLTCVALTARAAADRRRGDTDTAAARLAEVLRVAGPWRTLEALVELAAVHVARGEALAAADTAAHALWLGEQHGWRLHHGRAHHLIALSRLLVDRDDEALASAQQARALHNHTRQRLREAEDLMLIARLTGSDHSALVTSMVSEAAGTLAPAVLRTLRS